MSVRSQASQTDSDLGTSNQNLKEISTSLKGYNGLSSNYIRFYENGIDQISAKMDELANLYAVAYAALAKLEEAAEVKKQIEELKRKIKLVNKSIDSVNESIDSVNESISDENDEEEPDSSYLDRLYSDRDSLEKELDDLQDQLTDLNNEVEKLKAKYEQLINEARSIVSGY